MKKFLLMAILVISFNFSHASEITDKAEKSIKTVFGEDIKLDFRKYRIPEKLKINIQNIVRQSFFRNEVYIWKIVKNDSIVSYAILDNVIGKSLPITFLVIFDLDANIISTEIIKYRELIGGEIRNKKWNKQFIGKNSYSDFTVGGDISVISGATMSVYSVSRGIQKLTFLINKIKREL